MKQMSDDFVGKVCGGTLHMYLCITWIRRVLGIHRKLTVIDSFFMNSEAMSPNPAPCNQSRTRSKFVLIWTALDQENNPSEKKRMKFMG